MADYNETHPCIGIKAAEKVANSSSYSLFTTTMVRLRKNNQRFSSPTPVSAPLHIPLSSTGHSPYNNPSQNLIHLSPSVFTCTPHSSSLQFHSISQPAHILYSSEPSKASFQDLGSAPPPVHAPHFTSSLSVVNPQPPNIFSSWNLGLVSSAHHLEESFQNLSIAPPPGFNSYFAHSQPQYAPQPSIVFSSGNTGFHLPTSEDDDDMKVEGMCGIVKSVSWFTSCWFGRGFPPR